MTLRIGPLLGSPDRCSSLSIALAFGWPVAACRVGACGGQAGWLAGCGAAGARQVVRLTSRAQAIRAILLASATAAFLAGILASSRANQGCLSGWARARPISPVAATTRS